MFVVSYVFFMFYFVCVSQAMGRTENYTNTIAVIIESIESNHRQTISQLPVRLSDK